RTNRPSSRNAEPSPEPRVIPTALLCPRAAPAHHSPRRNASASLGKVAADVDPVEAVELLGDQRNAVVVIERARNGDAEAARLRRRDRAGCFEDALQELGAVSQIETHPRIGLDGRRGEPYAPGGDVRPADVECPDDGHRTKALTTLHGAPRARRSRYWPTAAGITIVSAMEGGWWS